MAEDNLEQRLDHVEQVDLQVEMQRSYLDYAMSVIVGRALPDVRDGLKPVHRRVLYAMYDGGYRPDKQFSKCSRVVGDVMGQYHPHGDAAIYDTLVRLVQDWNLRYPLVQGQGKLRLPWKRPGRSTPLYRVQDGATCHGDGSRHRRGNRRFPGQLRRQNSRADHSSKPNSKPFGQRLNRNCRWNGDQHPPHNLREVAEGAIWYLENPEANEQELLAALMQRIKGPDFPTGAEIIGRRGIEDAYRTGRGSITMRAIVNVEELHGRSCLVVTELPYQVNPDNLAQKIAELVREGRLSGIADIRDETSGRTGQRLVIVLKKDAVARVVLNNLYKFTQLRENFSANMLALVDGIPRTLSLDGFITNWVAHQIEVIVRRTQFRLRKAEERAHILRGYLKALDALDAVIALIRKSQTVDDARDGLIKLLKIDELQARAILNMQLRQLAALERQKIIDEAAELEKQIKDFKAIIASPKKQREIVKAELVEVVDRHGDDRRTQIQTGGDDDVSTEDLIPEEEMVITVTRGGYIKRTKSTNYRSQHRGGKGVRGASLRADDVVSHFFVTTTHHWLLFFTNKGRVYRAKAYEVQEAGRDAKGQHVANLLALQPDEQIASILDIKDYNQAPYLVLATRSGLVKKTSLDAYDTPRSGGIIAIKLKEEDELVSAMLVSESDDLLLVSRKGMSIRFSASDESLRPMGRDTSGNIGMNFRKGDFLLSASVINDIEDSYVFIATEGGYAKRTEVSQYRPQNRGGLGIKVAKLEEKRGDLVGALICSEADEVLVVLASGKVVRSAVSEVPAKGRDTMGVVFARFDDEDSVIGLAKNSERNLEGTTENE